MVYESVKVVSWVSSEERSCEKQKGENRDGKDAPEDPCAEGRGKDPPRQQVENHRALQHWKKDDVPGTPHHVLAHGGKEMVRGFDQ